MVVGSCLILVYILWNVMVHSSCLNNVKLLSVITISTLGHVLETSARFSFSIKAVVARAGFGLVFLSAQASALLVGVRVSLRGRRVLLLAVERRAFHVKRSHILTVLRWDAALVCL